MLISQPASPSLHSSSSVPTATPPVTHVLCCPSCQFMSLQASQLVRHAFARHSLTSVTVYRCSLCQAASTQSDIMREHAAIYHGLTGDYNILAHLITDVIGQPSSESAAPQATGGNPAAPVGSKKRKSNVPERVPSHIDHTEEALEAAAAAATTAAAAASSPKQKKARPASLLGGRNVQSQQHQQQPAAVLHQSAAAMAQILLPYGVLSGVGGVLSNGAGGCQPAEAALDLSTKGRTMQAPPQPPLRASAAAAVFPSSSQQQLLQQELQQQQQQQQRQNFSSAQNARLQLWFGQNRTRPYPSTEDTKALAVATGLNYSQVKKWFANKRMRSKVGVTGAAVVGVVDEEVDDEAPRSWIEDTFGSGSVAPGNEHSSRAGSSPPSSADFDRSDEMIRPAAECSLSP